MSIRVWGLNRETGEVVHINSVSKDMRGKIICLDENCGEELIICKGEINKPYFSHKSNSSCSGGSTETLLHSLSKQILMKCEQFTLPEESVIFRGKKIVFAPKRNILVRDVELNAQVDGSSLRLPVRITDFSDNVYYIEPSVRGISPSRVESLRKRDVNVVEIDLRKYVKTGEDLDFEEFSHFVSNGSGVKNFVCSPRINSVERKVSDAMYSCNGDYIACPARDYEGIVLKKDCSSCPFYMYNSGDSIVCSGRGCFSAEDDFSIESLDARRIKYKSRMPKVVFRVDSVKQTSMFGNCKVCGKPHTFSRCTPKTRTIDGISTLDRFMPHNLYAVCDDCFQYNPLMCPKCGSELQLYVNNHTGSVFIGCEKYSHASKCDFTITLYDRDKTDDYSEDLKCVGSFMNFYSDLGGCLAKLAAKRRSRSSNGGNNG